MACVVDYSSTSSDSEFESEINPTDATAVIPTRPRLLQHDESHGSDAKPILPLPPPNFGKKAPVTDEASVFSNPFQVAEATKEQALERHVKLTARTSDVRTLNGKSICWNFRKGRCRFGHNCKYAHDSDLIRSAAALAGGHVAEKLPRQDAAEDPSESVCISSMPQTWKKKRSGLSQGLIPPKKALKAYTRQQIQERPWTAPE